jgi:N-acetylneuraminate synthase|tara:strand:+ start:710 stop:1777 length:1068 start_codon:yes stop_codon:yes gene_type:complete
MLQLRELITQQGASSSRASGSRPLIIAEAGVNHEGNMEIAYQLIDEAAEAGADAIKFQTYKAELLASQHSPAYWNTQLEPTKTQYDLFKKYDRFWKNEYEELKQRCDLVGIEFLSTPFDVESVAFLSDLMSVFKISSSDITNKPLIEDICGYQKPIILSTGASDIVEVDEALGWIDQLGVSAALMHCVLSYPTKDCDAHLGMIKGLKKRYPQRVIGYSDHTLPGDMKSLEIATILGAEILEKHFTHDKTLPGNDHYHAMDKEDLEIFVKNIDSVLALIGESRKRVLEIEEIARRNARRSLVASRAIPAGSVISIDDLTYKRPAHGISPKLIDHVQGRKARQPIAEDDIITWDLLS